MATSAPASTTPDLGFLLARASHALATELTLALSAIGITPRSYCVLSNALGAELTQSRLGELCNLDKTTMVVAVDELERAGLAERRPSSTDRRARIIAVTDAGAQAVAEGREIVRRTQDDVLAVLGEGEREVFVDCLVRLAGDRLATPVKCEHAPRRRAPRPAR